MKRIRRDPEKHEVLGIFDAIGKRRSFTLDGSDSQAQFLACVAQALTSSRQNPAQLHGRHTEAKFGFVAASLGECAIIKEEDAGEVFVHNPDGVQPPDWRLRLLSGQEFFVEAKNHHKKQIESEWWVKDRYLRSLLAYASAFDRELKIAIFWSRWNLWSLVSPEHLTRDGDWHSITLPEALKASEMGLLGEVMIGTRPPLTFRIITDSSASRHVDAQGHCAFTIGDVDFFCARQRIEDPFERQLAWYIIRYGSWSCTNTAQVTDGVLESVDFVFEPEMEMEEDQGFELLGPLSGMISRFYDDLTRGSDGGLRHLAPTREPGSLGVVIPKDYKGKALPLWRLHFRPTASLGSVA